MGNVALGHLVIDNTQEGLFRVNRRAFTDPSILELEHVRVFERSWIYAGHESNNRWLASACLTKAEWRALTGVAGHPEWANYPLWGGQCLSLLREGVF